ncbi:hypothetical protein LPYR103PRE_09010 [Segatella asaccharophila]|jgi:hypothetical protein
MAEKIYLGAKTQITGNTRFEKLKTELLILLITYHLIFIWHIQLYINTNIIISITV